MRITKFFLAGFLMVLLGYPALSQAEDIDLYSGLSGAAGVPNLMFVLDSSANNDGNFAACTYYDGTSPSLGDKTLGNEQCALVNIMHSLPTNADGSALLNLGITDSKYGVYFKLTPIDDHAYTGSYSVPTGTTNRQAFILAVKALTKNTGNVNQGKEMQETWAYYTGGNGGATGTGLISGVSYPGTNATTGCQKNYAAFLGGVDSNAHADNGSTTDETNLLNAAIDNVVATALANESMTAAQGAAYKTAYKTIITTGAQPDKYAGNGVAREWSRFMYNYDANATSSGTQSIVTYSISIQGGANADMTNFIKDIASFGGGKSFAATSYSEIYNDILKILNEVQAVNSVFASSSLPVSVNTQGTFLNQVFIGMFRPDASAAPRWLGNLKQYQFLFDTSTQTVSLGDSLGQSAVSAAGTGFISTNAASYWTCGGASTDPDKRACSPVADPANGYWVHQPQSAGGAFDLPDGELVEKGGSAQMLRMDNLTNDYTTGSASNLRKLYTYCPSGASCAAALTASSNAFSTANIGIAAAAFGSSVTVGITSIVRTGTTALVTTAGNHGFTNGDTITISGATQNEYNVTQAITVNSTTTFTITGLPDYPSSPNTGAYIAAVHNATTKSIASISVASSTTANANGCASGTVPNINCNTVTVNLPGHGYVNNDSVTIGGVAPAEYSGTVTVKNSSANSFDYYVPVTPTSPSLNAYTATLPQIAITAISAGNGTNKTVITAANNFTAGQSITISGSANAANNGTFTVGSATSGAFKITNNSSVNCSSACGNVAPPAIPIAAGNISRSSVTATTATATGITASAFSNGQTVYLAKASGSSTNETAYAPATGSRAVVITCSGTCTSFTFPISTTPATTTLTTTSPNAALVGASVTIAAGQITRAGSTATVTGVVANTFSSGQSIDIGVSGSAVGSESAYLSPAAGWTITCPLAACTSFTFGPVALTPASPATGSSITAFKSGGTPTDPTSLINWVRGQDNYGDEVASPGSPITVRPSIHGDVLHSRPVVINYGGTTGVVAFYGSNDGVFHAVNANQTNPLGSTLPNPGSELWGFVPTEFFNRLGRQRTNVPQLNLPTTPPGILPAPQTKDYFADGSTGVYQEITAPVTTTVNGVTTVVEGTTTTARIYITMRRGGSIIYALNVLNPASPQFLWKISNATTGFTELGQTWSRPKTAKLAGYVDGNGNSKAVLIFGAGYDPTEDSEPPIADTQGRGIFIVDAETGALVWSATPQTAGATSCTGSSTQATCLVSGMDYSIPSDVTLVDHDSNGKIDRLYVGDTGGNIWRVDFEPASGNTPDHWQINKLAALGCDTGVCTTPATSSTTPRKFFYPPDVVPAGGYDIVLAGSGDREHPLRSNQASTSVTNRLYGLSDLRTGNDFSSPSTPTPITQATLFNATSSSYAGVLSDGTTPANGFYITLATGEKVVNAPATVAGLTFFGTNQPATPSANSCSTNLGIARGYQISPFTGNGQFSEFQGGGLPPTPVYGLVEIVVPGLVDNNGDPVKKQVPFCIGCGGSGSTSGSANGGLTGGCAANSTAEGCSGGGGGGSVCGAKTPIEACKAIIKASTDRHRTYWYLDKDQ